MTSQPNSVSNTDEIVMAARRARLACIELAAAMATLAKACEVVEMEATAAAQQTGVDEARKS